MEDSRIIELFQNRDEEAIRQTERKYSRYLYVIAQNILNNAEDSSECVNDTYLKAWNTIPPNLPPRLACYLGKITRELSIGRWHKSRTKKRGGTQYALSLDELEECVPSGSSPEQEADAELLTKTIRDYLQGCKEEARTVFLQRYYFCDSIKFIAENRGMSESKVKSLLYRTRLALKEYLEKEGFVV